MKIKALALVLAALISTPVMASSDQPIQEMRGNATGTGLNVIASLMNSYTDNKRAAANNYAVRQARYRAEDKQRAIDRENAKLSALRRKVETAELNARLAYLKNPTN